MATHFQNSLLVKPIALIVMLILLPGIAVGCQIPTPPPTPTSPPGPFVYQTRVKAMDTKEYVPYARVTIESGQIAPLIVEADTNGFARIFIDRAYVGKPGRLIVEAPGYERNTQNIDLWEASLPGVVLLERSGATSTYTPQTPSDTTEPTNTSPTASTTDELLTPTNIGTPTISTTSVSTAAMLFPTTEDGLGPMIIFADDKDSLTVYVPAQITSSLQDLNLEYGTSTGTDRYYFIEGFTPYVDGTVPPPFCLHLERAGSSKPFPTECHSVHKPIVRLPSGSIFWWDEFERKTKTLFVNLGDKQLYVCDAGFSRCEVKWNP